LWGGSVRTAFLYTLLAALLLPTVSVAAPGDDAAVVDSALLAPRLGLAFVMRPGGGVEALDLASGAVRWRSDKAARPLALVGDRLVAQAEPGGPGALALVMLDTRNGVERSSARVPIDAAVTASTNDSAGTTFRAWADASGSQLAVSWEHSSLSGGASQGYLPAASEGQTPSVGGGEASFTVQGSSLQLEEVNALSPTVERSVRRAALEEVSVAAVRSSGRQLLSADGRHVLVSERVASAEFRMDHHRWSVYDRESGAKLGSFRSIVSSAPFVVVGRTLYYTSPSHVLRRDERLARRSAMLRAVDLGSGNELWAKSVRDPAFRGPFPP
jgi:hypothetical protein